MRGLRFGKSLARQGITLTALLLGIATLRQTNAAPPKPPLSGKVSYFKQIVPILRAKCQACHQPASLGGQLSLTSHDAFVKGGEHGVVFQSGKPDASPLLEYLTGKRALMPKGGPPLPNADIALFRRWIAEGAQDDTPAIKDPIDAAHPPTYSAPPVLTALAYSPDGKTLAVSGYRETLLHQADGSGLIARLVGQSQKILSLAYSPDGKLLAAVGGTPAVFGEIQLWDTAANKPAAAFKNGFDTLFGASFSPDGKQLAFGCADNSVRLITVPEGKQILKFDNHSDWVFATTFSTDSKHFLSTGRDRAIKLVLIDGQSGSFIDDINTHTSPMRSLARRPKADQALCGGEDGIPRLYQVFRTKVRTMNQEDHNLLRAFDRQLGTITALAFNSEGTQFVVGSESSVVNVYAVEDGKKIASLRGHRGAIYVVAFQPDGKRVATGGFDGKVRIYDLPSGRLVKAFVPVPISAPPKQVAHQ